MNEDDPAAYFRTMPKLDRYYLEDSVVLGIWLAADRLKFEMELVLTERHPKWRPPLPGQQHCYRRGTLLFSGVSDLLCKALEIQSPDWVAKGPHLEVDFGNVHHLALRDGRYEIAGDFGEFEFRAASVAVSLKR